jgi:hypothetical protein
VWVTEAPSSTSTPTSWRPFARYAPPANDPAQQRASDTSLLRRLEAFTERNKELRTANHDLKSSFTLLGGRLGTRLVL